MSRITGYFCDINGVIYTVADFYDGGTNAPYHVIVDGDTVLHCGDFNDGDGYAIDGTYTLWTTLTALAKQIEN